ncbi:MAG: hypothetical protein ACE5PM_01080 [Candidatus Hydrothermarchaeales archaeon]
MKTERKILRILKVRDASISDISKDAGITSKRALKLIKYFEAVGILTPIDSSGSSREVSDEPVIYRYVYK